MAKLCKLAKKEYLKEHADEYGRYVIHAHFLCTKCGRAANIKSAVCKPLKLEHKINEDKKLISKKQKEE